MFSGFSCYVCSPSPFDGHHSAAAAAGVGRARVAMPAFPHSRIPACAARPYTYYVVPYVDPVPRAPRVSRGVDWCPLPFFLIPQTLPKAEELFFFVLL